MGTEGNLGPAVKSGSALASVPVHLGVFLVSLSGLMLELALTRIFSAILWYHFAFFAISVALLGLSFSGVVLYLRAGRSSEASVGEAVIGMEGIWWAAFLLPLAIVLSLIFILGTFVQWSVSWEAFAGLARIYILAAIPFFLSGLCLALVLRRYGKQASTIYFADLAGAAAACILIIPALDLLGGVTGILLVAVFAGLASLAFAIHIRQSRRILASATLVIVFGLLVLGNQRWHWVRIRYDQGHFLRQEPLDSSDYLYDRWNAFSRVSVRPMFWESSWGLSPRYRGSIPPQLVMYIDNGAAMTIVRFHGDLGEIEFVKHDITALGYYLRRGADRVCIIGPGGGRDILTALAFQSKAIDAVEINPLVIKAMRQAFREYAGYIYDQPNVRIVEDDGRSWIRRSREHYDLIQGSLVDTFAATSAGAFALVENNLYTVEAFADYWDHLSPDGILALSRWFLPQPRETLRLVSLALETLEKKGVADPGQHIVVMETSSVPEHVATFLLKRSPFTSEEVQLLEGIAEEMGFHIVYTPHTPAHPVFAELIASTDRWAFYERYSFNVRPTSDDKPFFFQTRQLSGKNAFWRNLSAEHDLGLFLLFALLILSLVAAVGFLLVPFVLFRRRRLRDTPGLFPVLLFFACLGSGFMLIEVSFMQRFLLFLGRPIYALAVILFSLLFFGGLGSYLTRRLRRPSSNLGLIIPALACLILTYTWLLPWLFPHALSQASAPKIALTVALLSPLGLLMGMPFPIGVKLLAGRRPDIIPWAWAVNGATSVLGSVLATLLALIFGLRMVSITGAIIYLAALIALSWRAGQRLSGGLDILPLDA